MLDENIVSMIELRKLRAFNFVFARLIGARCDVANLFCRCQNWAVTGATAQIARQHIIGRL